jgi:hypothetical protein
MDAARRFLEYAAAFESSYEDDDWTRLEPFFTEDAVYAVSGEPPLGGRWEGRAQVLSHLREGLDQLDRRFDARRVEPVGQPTVGDASFEFGWRASYQKAGYPDLSFEGTEHVEFEGDRIRLLEDRMEDGSDRRIQEYIARYLG